MYTPNTIFANRYRLIRKIGSGGFADVWQAADQMAEDMVVAVKIYVPDRGMDDRGIKQFRREYAGFMGLNHPNLLTARYFDIWEGRPYLIMPYMRGGSLADRLTDTGPLKEADILKVLQDVSSALAYLHRKEILHQDIKPDNILIGDDGEYLLTDFGISGRLRATLHKQTGSKTSLTIAYAAPERFDAIPRSLPASDIFSLGVLTYELATGEVPWMGNGGMSLKQGAEVPVLYPSSGSGLSKLMGWMLSADPHKRPAAEEVRQAAAACKVQPPKSSAARETRRTVLMSDFKKRELVKEPEMVNENTPKKSGSKWLWMIVGLVTVWGAYQYWFKPIFFLNGQMPVVETMNVLEITATSAIVSGSVTSQGRSSVNERGVCISNTSNPSLNDECYSSGAGTGEFSVVIENLLSHTRYHVRAYATSVDGTVYGRSIPFRTTSQQLVVLENGIVDEISESSARVSVRVSGSANQQVTSRGICVSTSPNPTREDRCYISGGGFGEYMGYISDLAPETRYFARFFAISEGGTAYSSQVEFRTLGVNPTVQITSLEDVTSSSVMVTSNVTSAGSSQLNSRGVCISTRPDPTLNDRCLTEGNTTGGFSVNFDGLRAGTTYYVRAFARNNAGTTFSAQRNFSTMQRQQTAGVDWPRDTRTTVHEVRNPRTGRVWMDRNLGANRVATSPTDEQAYGDLYQWGRPADGHQRRSSVTTPILSRTDQPGHGQFILSASNSNWDWRTSGDNQLWQGVNGFNNPCPSGFRLPTETEWDAERRTWVSNDAAGAFASPLKLTITGFRSSISGDLSLITTLGSYWSSTTDSRAILNAKSLRFDFSNASNTENQGASGRAVRCIKN